MSSEASDEITSIPEHQWFNNAWIGVNPWKVIETPDSKWYKEFMPDYAQRKYVSKP